MTLFCTWTALKSIALDNELAFRYYECPCKFKIIIIQNDTVWFTEIWKSCDTVSGVDEEQNNINLADFVDTYESSALKLS